MLEQQLAHRREEVAKWQRVHRILTEQVCPRLLQVGSGVEALEVAGLCEAFREAGQHCLTRVHQQML